MGESVSIRGRRILLGVTVFCWVDWAICEWVSLSLHPSSAHVVFTIGLRMLTVALSIATLLAYLVCPLLAAMRAGQEMGRQQRDSECTCGERRAVNSATVIPIRPVRHHTRSDN